MQSRRWSDASEGERVMHLCKARWRVTCIPFKGNLLKCLRLCVS